MRKLAWLVGVGLAACGDNGSLHHGGPATHDAAIDTPVAVPIDAPAGTPDLRPVPERMIDTAKVTFEDIAGDDCQVVEGCVVAGGRRKLLRFATVTGNFGTADLVMPPVPPAPPPGAGSDAGDDTYEWAPCHQKYHVRDFATFELLDANGVIAVQRKQAFCLEDDAPAVLGAVKKGFSCSHQGISIGWADVYAPDLACQFIDVTGQPAGAYTLRVTINPVGRLNDSDRSNNVVEMAVQLPADEPAPPSP